MGLYIIMARGPKKHLKRLNAPKKWMLDKLGGAFAPRPSCGPHKLRECIPLIVLLRNKLKYALTRKEVMSITMQRLVKVDAKVRTDLRFPLGFMDVLSIPKTNENFRVMYDVKGRFIVHRITGKEAEYKLCKVKSQKTGKGGVPYITTHDGRTIRYPDPDIKEYDTIKYNVQTGRVMEFVRFDVGQMAICTGGQNAGRIGTIEAREKHPGSFEIIHLRDANGHEYATRMDYVFVIGKGNHELVSLPRGKGLKLSLLEEFGLEA